MSRISDILLRARDTLADPNGERWSDPRLLRLLSEGQEDIAKQTRLLKGELDIETLAGESVYDLPSDVWLITRASFDGCKLPLHTHHELDELVRTRAINQEDVYYSRRGRGSSTSDFGFADYCWELDTGVDVEALIYDRRNADSVKLYPIPIGDEAKLVTVVTSPGFDYDLLPVDGVATEIEGLCPEIENFDTLFGVVTDIIVSTITETPSVFGVVVNVTDSVLSSPYGVIVNATSTSETYNLSSAFGVTAGVTTVDTGVVHLWYIKVPTATLTMDSTLDLASIWDTALKYYLIGHAFDDDYDTKFEAKSAKALTLYERELAIAKKTDALDGVRSSQYRTDYRGAFEQ